MSTPPSSSTSYPQEPTPIATPSSVVLSYGDIVQIVNQNGIWMGQPTSYGGGTNPKGTIPQATGQSTAQQFVVLSTSSTVPLDSNGLPATVQYMDSVVFLQYPSPTGIPTYSFALSGSNPLSLQQGYVNNKQAWWTLRPSRTQTGPIIVPGNINAEGNNFYLQNVGNSHYKYFYLDDAEWKNQSDQGKSDVFQIWIVNGLCGQTSNCTPGSACWNNKCYPNTAPPYAAYSGNPNFLQNVFNFTCTPAASNSNNLEQPFCLGNCLSQTPLSVSRNACDNVYSTYCNQVWGGIIPPTGHVCSCVQAAQQGISQPQCFWPNCANNSASTYWTGAMQQELATAGCTAACVQIFDCQGNGNQSQCNIANNTFDEACGGAPGSKCGPQNSCQTGSTCVNGLCQTNNTPGTCNPPCTSTQTCTNGSCVAAQTTCSATQPCPLSSQICNSAGQCVFPECSATVPCNAPQVCNSQGQCINQCSQNSDCTNGQICSNGACVTPPPPAPPNKLLTFLKENWKYFAIGGGTLLLLIIVLGALSKATKKKTTSSSK